MLMKKIALLLPIIICGLILSSCKDDAEKPDTDPLDTSIAASVAMYNYYLLEATATYNGSVLHNLNQGKSSFLDIMEISDTEISLYIASKWDDAIVWVQIPSIPLSGKNYDVTFDNTFSDATIWDNHSEYSAITGSVNGWIREKSIAHSDKSVNTNETRTTLAQYTFDCEINIDCVVDGKPLTLKITNIGAII